jgi:threonine/homoserine/homoserine lactone efflux protein
MHLRIDLIPLAGAIVLMSVSTTMAVVLIRSMNRAPGEAAPLGTTMGLAFVVAVWLIGLALLFQGLFE